MSSIQVNPRKKVTIAGRYCQPTATSAAATPTTTTRTSIPAGDGFGTQPNPGYVKWWVGPA